MANAQANLARMYRDGRGMPKDEVKSFIWYRKAAEQGHEYSVYIVGVMYLRGLGVPKDEGEAVKWYRKAAEQGNSDSQMGLGIIYEKGLGVPKDEVEAAKWYSKATNTRARETQQHEEFEAKAKKQNVK